MSHTIADKDAEIDRNFERFLELLPGLVAEHAGEYVLMRDREIVEFFPSALDAQIAGNQRYADSGFSIQEVEMEPEHLGVYSLVC